ncbi:MAG: alpha/beta fold hydrolase [Alphaproteobacteria bacterium]
MDSASLDPAAIVADIESRSERLTTPAPGGHMVWHRWAGPAGAPTLALFHGGYGSWTHWIRNVDTLSARYTVLAADLPGLGDSDAVPEPYDGWSIARIVADGLAGLVPADEPVRIAGFSFGGVIGTPAAALLGDRVRTLVLVGSGGMALRRHPLELKAWRHLPDRAAQAAIHRENLGILMIADPANIDPLAVHLQEGNARRGRTKSPPISRTPIVMEALPRVKGRVGVIFGERDATCEGFLDLREQALRAIRPDLDFRVVPGGGHWVAYETAEAFNGELLAMLDRLDSRP